MCDADRDTSTGPIAEGEPRTTRTTPAWGFVHANELETPFMTFRLGGAVLVDGAAAAQDSAARQQADIATVGRVRDSRFLLSGRIKTKRQITWQAGLLYDWTQKKWLVRQTALVVSVPEICSNFWIGRTKEGPSLNRVMVGYDGWTMERFTFSDAAIPLLADGIRWQGYLPWAHFFWNLGGFVDWLSEGETFSYFDNQIAGRIGYVRMDSDSAGRLLHIGFGFHDGIPNEGELRLKSKPELNSAPNFVDTGVIPATAALLGGLETYYRSGPWLFDVEWYLEQARSSAMHDPVFNGGEVGASWTLTGETRRYVVPGSYFKAVTPARSVFAGGPGAWEAVLRFSSIDLNDHDVAGGTFWRITPMINWHLSENVRLELVYGYGVLDRFGQTGRTQFFQTRLQTQY
jgi:phosphate-selective porin OprO and OprP